MVDTDIDFRPTGARLMGAAGVRFFESRWGGGIPAFGCAAASSFLPDITSVSVSKNSLAD